jgi:hypothetical protein
MRLNAGKRAVGALLACLDWDEPWSSRNWWILEQGVKPIEGVPTFEYVYDPNRAGTAEEVEKNKAVLEKVRPLAEKLPAEVEELKLKGWAPVVRQTAGPRVGAEPTMVETGPGEWRVEAGFARIVVARTSAQFQYSAPEELRPLYEVSSAFEYLLEHPAAMEKAGLAAGQVEGLRRLKAPGTGRFVAPSEMHELLWNWREAPAGAIREQARKDFLGAMDAAAQDCHGRVVEFVAGVRKVLTEEEIGRVKGVVEELRRAG